MKGRDDKTGFELRVLRNWESTKRERTLVRDARQNSNGAFFFYTFLMLFWWYTSCRKDHLNVQQLKSHLSRNVIEIIDDRMLVFDPKLNEDEFYYKGQLQTRRDVNKRQKKDHRLAGLIQ